MNNVKMYLLVINIKESNFFLFFLETFEKIKAQMAAALSGFKVGSLTPWGKIPEGANTTSTTKVNNILEQK